MHAISEVQGKPTPPQRPAIPVDLFPGMVFVFGSNLAGIHGAGAARFAAVRRGFPGHLGVGPAADCYAIPTKDCQIQPLPLRIIKTYVEQFKEFARLMEGADVKFQVTRIGCGLAGFHDKEIAPMFDDAPLNCWFDNSWMSFSSTQGRRFWGKF